MARKDKEYEALIAEAKKMVEDKPKSRAIDKPEPSEDDIPAWADIVRGVSRAPGGLFDLGINLLQYPFAAPKYILTGKNDFISSGADFTEKPFDYLTDSKYKRKDGKISKTTEWSEFLTSLLLSGGRSRGLKGIGKNLLTGSAVKGLSDDISKEVGQDSIGGRAISMFSPNLFTFGGGAAYRKARNMRDQHNIKTNTAGVSPKIYKELQELQSPINKGAIADLETPEGILLGQKYQQAVESNPALQSDARAAQKHFQNKVNVDNKTVRDPEPIGKALIDEFTKTYGKVKDQSNAALKKSFENLDPLVKYKGEGAYTIEPEIALKSIIDNPELNSVFFKLSEKDQGVFLKNFIAEQSGYSKNETLKDMFLLAPDNHPALETTDAVVPSNTVKTITDLYKNKGGSKQVKLLQEILEKYEGVMPLETLYDWRKDYSQYLRSQVKKDAISPETAAFLNNKVHNSVQKDINDRLKNIDAIQGTERAKNYDIYNKTYRDWFEEISPENVKIMSKTAGSPLKFFEKFTEALTDSTEGSKEKKGASQELKNFFQKMPEEFKQKMIGEIVFDMGYNKSQDTFSLPQFSREFNGLTKTQRELLSKLFSEANPGEKASLSDIVTGIKRNRQSLEFANTSKSGVRLESTMNQLEKTKTWRKLFKAATKAMVNPVLLLPEVTDLATAKFMKYRNKKAETEFFRGGKKLDEDMAKMKSINEGTYKNKHTYDVEKLLRDLMTVKGSLPF